MSVLLPSLSKSEIFNFLGESGLYDGSLTILKAGQFMRRTVGVESDSKCIN